jgi:hypothetical protein
MPNIWAHIQFGRETLSHQNLLHLLDDAAWKTAFQLGCQGPDFLFYHHFLPWQSQSALNLLGSQMHNTKCGPFLLSLLAHVRNRELNDPVAAYAYGFLMHHLLDRHMHPFVFSRSGFKKWHHQRFETAMDACVMWRRAGIRTCEVPVAPEIDTGSCLPGQFAADFHDLVSQHYPVLARQFAPAHLDAAVADMIRAHRLFFDPRGWKGKLLLGRLAPFSPPLRLPEWDVMNDQRERWVDPTDRTVYHALSADDLWDNALADALDTAGTALDWLLAEDDEEADKLRATFAAKLGDISYETGLACGEARIMYAEPVIPA